MNNKVDKRLNKLEAELRGTLLFIQSHKLGWYFSGSLEHLENVDFVPKLHLPVLQQYTLRKKHSM